MCHAGKSLEQVESQFEVHMAAGEQDDFTQEIESTRKNEELMSLLQKRAEDPATVSFQKVKQLLGLR